MKNYQAPEIKSFFPAENVLSESGDFGTVPDIYGDWLE